MVFDIDKAENMPNSFAQEMFSVSVHNMFNNEVDGDAQRCNLFCSFRFFVPSS